MKIRQMLFVICFFALLSSTIILYGVYFAFGIKADIPLDGYVKYATAPTFNSRTILSGEFQSQAESWLNQNMLPHGFYIKIHNQLQYTFFRRGRNVIGSEGYIFEEDYINDVILQEGESLEEEKIAEYVSHLEGIHQKLEKLGKHLFVYTTPTKGVHYYDNIPHRYKILQAGDENTIPRRKADVLKEELSKTPVNFFDSNEVIYQNPDIVPFYKKGIHWSRPIEQLTTIEVINRLAEISGKSFPSLTPAKLNSKSTPFLRDNDVYNIMNIYWSCIQEEYFEYELEKQENSGDELKILLQGGSFADGLKDYFDIYPGNRLDAINYDNFITDSNGEVFQLEDSWDNLDLQHYLDNADFVVIEINEAVISLYSSGFAEYLDEFLENSYDF